MKHLLITWIQYSFAGIHKICWRRHVCAIHEYSMGTLIQIHCTSTLHWIRYLTCQTVSSHHYRNSWSVLVVMVLPSSQVRTWLFWCCRSMMLSTNRTKLEHYQRMLSWASLQASRSVAYLNFVGQFSLLVNLEHITQLENNSSIHNNAKYLSPIKKLTLLVSKSFH